jgi:hypothetical protein
METKTDGITNIEMPIYYGTDDGGELEEYMLELLKRINEEYDYEQMMTEAGVSEQMKDAFWRRDTSGVSTYEDAKKALELANSIKAKTRQLYADIEDKYTVRIYRNGTLMEGYQNGKLETVNLDCDASDPYHIPTDVPMEDNVIVPLWATGGV